MQKTRSKLIFFFLVFILLLSSQACLLEQGISLAMELTPQDHHSTEHNEHENGTPPHHHDDQRQEADICCNTILTLFVRSSYLPTLIQTEHFLSSSVVSKGGLETIESTPNFHFNGLFKIIRLRTRDKYALSYLIHAPPLV